MDISIKSRFQNIVDKGRLCKINPKLEDIAGILVINLMNNIPNWDWYSLLEGLIEEEFLNCRLYQDNTILKALENVEEEIRKPENEIIIRLHKVIEKGRSYEPYSNIQPIADTLLETLMTNFPYNYKLYRNNPDFVFFGDRGSS